MAKKLAKKKTAKKKIVRKAVKAKKAGRMIYYFGQTRCDGDGTMRDLLGGKGANLAQMVKIGLPVPSGFTITTQTCIDYYANRQKFPAGLEDQILRNLKTIEKETKNFSSRQLRQVWPPTRFFLHHDDFSVFTHL